MDDHVFDRLVQSCLACGRTVQQQENEPKPCNGVVQYREWLRGLVFTCEPIIPKRQHDITD